MGDSNTSGLAVRFLAIGDHIYEKERITPTTINQLIQLVQTRQRMSAYLSLDEYGEDDGDFFTIDIDNIKPLQCPSHTGIKIAAFFSGNLPDTVWHLIASPVP